MKQRILQGWNIRRILFVSFGLYIIYTSATGKSWLGVALGVYFASMGTFSFGCAAGNCYGNACNVTPIAAKEEINKELNSNLLEDIL